MKKRYLRCTQCTARADMKKPRSCSGWSIAPTEICPKCIERSMREREGNQRLAVGSKQKAVMHSTPPAVKLDGRPPSAVANQRQAKKRSQAKRPGRGAEFVIHGKIKSKRDPDLQKRIDMVVANALNEAAIGHSTDVVNDYRHLRFSASGLKVHRLG